MNRERKTGVERHADHGDREIDPRYGRGEEQRGARRRLVLEQAVPSSIAVDHGKCLTVEFDPVVRSSGRAQTPGSPVVVVTRPLPVAETLEIDDERCGFDAARGKKNSHAHSQYDADTHGSVDSP